ncbi:MAG: hypothetical protein K6E40_11575 [Desulfovibrio sp.]|nr:hypothetical protein [Desulfovibrio sp.]
MWRGEIIKTLFLDIMPLKRRGLAFTWKSLDQLRARLLAATVYHFDALPEPESAAPQAEAAPGAGQDVLDAQAAPDQQARHEQVQQEQEQQEAQGGEARQPGQPKETQNPSLFDVDGNVMPLPQADMLLEFSLPNGERRAVLLSDREQWGVRMFVFRYSEERQRWMWPLVGVHYGPTFNENSRIAVYEPTALAKMSAGARTSMIREHALDAGKAVQLLRIVRQGGWEPEGERGMTAAEIAAGKTAKVASPRPSSMARASRTHHEAGHTGKGARRS